jgi:hypothetical protein
MGLRIVKPADRNGSTAAKLRFNILITSSLCKSPSLSVFRHLGTAQVYLAL